jgi:hypothetical protein
LLENWMPASLPFWDAEEGRLRLEHGVGAPTEWFESQPQPNALDLFARMAKHVKGKGSTD